MCVYVCMCVHACMCVCVCVCVCACACVLASVHEMSVNMQIKMPSVCKKKEKNLTVLAHP